MEPCARSQSWWSGLARAMTVAPALRRELDGDAAHPAGRTRDDDHVARCGADGPHRRPRRGPRDVERPRCVPADRGRLGREVRTLAHDELGVARSLVGEPDDLVAGCELIDARTERLDHTGEVAALAGRERRRPAVFQQALPDRRLAGIDGCGAHPDEHLPVSRRGIRDVDDVQHIDVAVVVEADGLHAQLLSGRCFASSLGPLLGGLFLGRSGADSVWWWSWRTGPPSAVSSSLSGT